MVCCLYRLEENTSLGLFVNEHIKKGILDSQRYDGPNGQAIHKYAWKITKLIQH